MLPSAPDTGSPGGEICFSVPPGTAAVVRVLERAGYPAYLVGGGLRDALLGRIPHDWDVATAARPEDMLRVFREAGVRTVATGLAHGTVTALAAGEAVECTSYRVDGTYSDARHPDAVTFADRIGEDLARRDFTVNAMACRLPLPLRDGGVPASDVRISLPFSSEEWVDLFGGREDLRRGVLRCVGDPDRRFGEDALRMLRAVRFCAQLGFSVTEDTKAAMYRCRDGLRQISRERVAAELMRLLTYPCREALLLMREVGFWPYVFGIGAARELPPVARLAETEQLPAEAPLRLAHLCAEWGGNETLAVCRGLRLSRAVTERTVAAVEEMALPFPGDDAALRQRMAQSRGVAEDAVRLCLVRGTSPGTDAWREVLFRCRTIRERKDALTIAELAVNGRDVVSVCPGLCGPEIGQAMKSLLVHVWEHPEDNTREVLLRLAQKR